MCICIWKMSKQWISELSAIQQTMMRHWSKLANTDWGTQWFTTDAEIPFVLYEIASWYVNFQNHNKRWENTLNALRGLDCFSGVCLTRTITLGVVCDECLATLQTIALHLTCNNNNALFNHHQYQNTHLNLHKKKKIS